MRYRWAAWIAATGLSVVAAMPAMPVLASAPAVSLSATSLDFGSVAWLQQAPTQNLVLTNTGDAALKVQSFAISGVPNAPEDFYATSDQCSSPYLTIAPGAQCQITLAFRPQAGGPRSATALVYDNAAGSPQSVTLSGRGTGGVITLSSQSIDFGRVLVQTTSAPMSFAVANIGDGPVTMSRTAINPANPASGFAISQDLCSNTTLGPGQRCSISATASPPSISSLAYGQVDIFDNAGSGKQQETLYATGGGAQLTTSTLFQSSFNIGLGTTSVASQFQAHASGTLPVQISSVGLDNSTLGFRIASDTCSGTSLAAGAPFPTCEVDVVFSPVAVGSVNANLVFHDNEASGSHSQYIAGTGFAPVAILSTTALDFGLQAAGTSSAPQVVTVTNPSPQPLTITTAVLSGQGAPYYHLVSDACTGTTVAPSGSCSVGVVFSPPFPLQFPGTLSFNDGAQGSPQTVSIDGEGEGAAFTISTAHMPFGNLHTNVASSPQSVTLTNTSATAKSYGHLFGGGLVSGCTAPVAPGSSCNLAASITPTVVGPQSMRLSIFDSANNVQFVQADWNGISGWAFIEDGLVNGLLVQRAGSSMLVPALVRNGGSDVLNIGQVSLTGTPPAVISADNCSKKAVPVGGVCTFLITATPTAAGGWSTTITVPSDAAIGGNPALLQISGWAGAPTQPVFSPSSLTFPAQQVGAAESTQMVWFIDGLVPSLGAQTTTISSVALGGPDASSFRVAWDGCTGMPVGPAYSCPVSVGFDPTAARTLNASMIFNDDAVGSPQVISLSGVGLPPPLISIAVTPANSSLASGLTAQFTATAAYSDSSTADITASVTWASSISTVATINAGGLATAAGLGTTTISATLGSVVGSTSLSVTAPTLVSIAVSPANSSLVKGLNGQFAATGTYTDATITDLTASVSWASSSSTVATISAAGLAQTAGIGTTSISATLGSVVGSTSLTVTAPTLVSVAVTPANSGLAKGLSRQFTATGTYTDASTADLTASVSWASSSGAVATTNPGGLVQAVGVGTATISATLGSVVGSTSLDVTAATLVGIAVTPANSSLVKGLTSQFTATGTYTDATTADLTGIVSWSSSNSTVAPISAGGLAQTSGVGTTTISATLGSVVGSTSLTVTAPTLVSVAVTPANFGLAKGLSRPFTATGTYTDSSTADLTASVSWASSSGAVATINPAGLVQAVGVGTATISATLGSVVGSTSFTVSGPALVSLAVIPADSSLAKGLNRQFTAIGTLTDGSTADLTVSSTFTSSVPTVAAITTIGMAHAVGPGTTIITATVGSVSGSTSLIVTTPDKALTITGIAARSSKLDAVAGVTFTDADPTGTLAQYSATIAWGDNSTPSAAGVSKNPSGGFAAGGTHHYAKAGAYTVTVTVKDVGGAMAIRSTALKVS